MTLPPVHPRPLRDPVGDQSRSENFSGVLPPEIFQRRFPTSLINSPLSRSPQEKGFSDVILRRPIDIKY